MQHPEPDFHGIVRLEDKCLGGKLAGMIGNWCTHIASIAEIAEREGQGGYAVRL
jgi:hypothetical protein